MDLRIFRTWAGGTPNHRTRSTIGLRTQRLRVFCLATNQDIPDSAARCRIRWLDTNQVWKAFGVLSQKLDRQWLMRRLAAGARLAVAEVDSQIVGWNFYQLKEIEQFDWITVILPPRAAMAVGGFVVPEHRGNRILASIKRFAGRSLWSEGIDRMVSIVETGNSASLNAHRNVGAVSIMSIGRIALPGFEIIQIGTKWALRRSGNNERFSVIIDSTRDPRW